MKDIKEDLYDDTLELWDLTPSVMSSDYGSAGDLFTFNNEQGSGEYWAYFCENLFAINAFHMHFKQDGIMRTQPAEHLSLTYYDIVKGMTQNVGAPLQPGCASVYIAEAGKDYLAHYEAGAETKAVSLTISPDYYRDYLQHKFGTIEDVRYAFTLVDGRRDLPELSLLLKRARAYKGGGVAASLFYEGVVSEAVALVLKKADEVSSEAVETLSPDDLHCANNLCEYIENNLDADLSINALTAKAYVGQTKLKHIFKVATGLTPSDYVIHARMNKAIELLSDTTLSISAIGQKVGYNNQGTFSAAFKRHTNYAPSNFRA